MNTSDKPLHPVVVGGCASPAEQQAVDKYLTSTPEENVSELAADIESRHKPLPGWAVIHRERVRQQISEGYTQEGDDRQTAGQLAMAASCYATPTTLRDYPLPSLWPWSGMVWKPSQDRIRELAKAGALIAAEIDRLTRAEGRP